MNNFQPSLRKYSCKYFVDGIEYNKEIEERTMAGAAIKLRDEIKDAVNITIEFIN